MLPQNGQQQRAHHQSGLPSFMSTNSSFDSSSYFSLDPSAAAKQMAALNAASQARIASNSRSMPSPLSTTGGTSSGSYLGGINSTNYPPASHDLSATLANGHANFQIPNSHSVPQTPNMVMNTSFLDSQMSQANSNRNSAQGNNTLKQRQQGFLHGLANVMAKRGTPLPPSLTGIPAPNYDPQQSPWTIIEPSSEVGSFRLAGKDINLFKLWGLVFQNGGGPNLTANNGWSSILPHFDLPEDFPQAQANGSTSVALLMSQYYMAILYPFEETYKRNLQDQQKKAMISRQGAPQQIQQAPNTLPGQNRTPQGILGSSQPVLVGPNMQRGGLNNTMGLIGQGVVTGSNVPVIGTNNTSFSQPTHTPQTPHQRPPSSALNPQPISQVSSHSLPSMPVIDSLSVQSVRHTSENNLLDQDLQGIKRKLDMDDNDSKRVRQKTEPPDTNSLNIGVTPDHNPSELSSGTSHPSHTPTPMAMPTRPRTQPSRRKIEYVPLAREVDTYGGRDLKAFENEWANIPQRRPLRDINDWGIIDIESLTMSIRSRLATELSYALTSLTLMSTMRGQTPGFGLPIYDCPDLLEEVLDLVEDHAFGGVENAEDSQPLNGTTVITTNRQLINSIHDQDSTLFASLQKHQGAKEPDFGPRPRPATTVLTILNIIRNLSIFTNNMEFISRHERIVDILLRLCDISYTNGGSPKPTSSIFSLSDLIAVRKDVIYILSNISGFIDLSHNSPLSKKNIQIAKRTFSLISSYLVDPVEAVSPLACVQQVGVPLTGSLKPSALADVALEVFTRFSQSDANRQVLVKAVPQTWIWCLLEALVHRLPIVDADFQLMARDAWLSYLEKTIMSIYSLAFLSPPELKQRVKMDRKLGFKSVILRMIQKFLMHPSHDGRMWFSICARRSIEAMKVVDDAEDPFDVSESTPPTMAFGMGYGETGDDSLEKGTGLLGGHRELAWDLLMMREVSGDEIMFRELESLARVEI